MRIRLVSAILVSAAVAYGATGDSAQLPTAVGSAGDDCRVAPASGDVAVLLRESGEVVAVGGDVELLRSDDSGQSWRREALPLRCNWPDIAEVGGRLLVSCAEPGRLRRLLVMAEAPDGGWSAPMKVDSSKELLIDTRLQTLPNGELLLFATHIDRPKDLDHAAYTMRGYRSTDGGTAWSEAEVVVEGRRGRRVEDTRSVVLGDGTLLLAYEVEKAEGKRSRIHQRSSVDGGRSWSKKSVIWRGGDVEPGGYLNVDGELWFVASTDEDAGGGSYAGATIKRRSSSDGGRSWGSAQTLVAVEDQISFGAVRLSDGNLLLPSLRRYLEPDERYLAVYRADPRRPGWFQCAGSPASGDPSEAQ